MHFQPFKRPKILKFRLPTISLMFWLFSRWEAYEPHRAMKQFCSCWGGGRWAFRASDRNETSENVHPEVKGSAKEAAAEERGGESQDKERSKP